MDVQLLVEKASFSYGRQKIFNDISLDLYKGETLCILGPNGCGKTTLLHCINRTLELSQGEVYLQNQPIKKMDSSAIARKIGIVFQEQNVPFPFSVLEVVRMGRAPYLGFIGMPSNRDTEIALKALSLVNILNLKDKPFTQTSGGERQLALIARALAQGPDIIMLDEPTSHLDFKNQTMVLSMIKKLSAHGISIIITTHLPDHAFRVSTKVALMNNGKLIDIGKPDETITRPNLKSTYGIDINVVPLDLPGNGDRPKICFPVMYSINENPVESEQFSNFLKSVKQKQ